MKAKDLRIGNYVNMDGYPAEVFKITKAFIGCGRFRQKNFDEIEPIPLTEEWLEKFGFKKCEFTGSLYKEDVWITTEDNIHWGLWDDKYAAVRHANTKYVHQLQNLYFALTGEDLYLL